MLDKRNIRQVYLMFEYEYSPTMCYGNYQWSTKCTRVQYSSWLTNKRTTKYLPCYHTIKFKFTNGITRLKIIITCDGLNIKE